MLNVFVPDFMRTFTLEYKEQVERFESTKDANDGIVLNRYSLPHSTWLGQDKNAANAAYHMTGGDYLFNVSATHFKVPLWISPPCFLKRPELAAQLPDASAKCRQLLGLSGYEPSSDFFHVDVEPNTGLTMGSKVLMQLNMEVGPLKFVD